MEQSQGTETPGSQPMRERSRSRLLSIGRPSMPPVLGALRNPITSRRLRRSRDEETNDGESHMSIAGEVESPKTPRFRLGMPTLPSTRLHLPHLTRTWTTGSSGPDSRPSTARPTQPDFRSEPLPAISISVADENGLSGPPPAFHGENTPSRSRSPAPLSSPLATAHPGQPISPPGTQDQPSAQTAEATSSPTGLTAPQRARRRCLAGKMTPQVRSHVIRCLMSGLFLLFLLAICKAAPSFRRPSYLPHGQLNIQEYRSHLLTGDKY